MCRQPYRYLWRSTFVWCSSKHGMMHMGILHCLHMNVVVFLPLVTANSTVPLELTTRGRLLKLRREMSLSQPSKWLNWMVLKTTRAWLFHCRGEKLFRQGDTILLVREAPPCDGHAVHDIAVHNGSIEQ